MRHVKQVIIIRDDLDMDAGKMSAQACHASNSALFNAMVWEKAHMITDPAENSYDEYTRTLKYKEFSAMEIWMEGIFTKVVLKVKSEDQLRKIHKNAVDAGLLCSNIIVDQGLTFFKEPTATCFAIGPNFSEDIDKVTKRLRLLFQPKFPEEPTSKSTV